MAHPSVEIAAIAAHLEPHRDFLGALLYRLTGDAFESEDIVQETFVRALARPELELRGTLRPWLVRVALRLGIDALRARRARPYAGAWLPTPIETGDAASSESPSARYDLVESATIAFLVALEALTPRQRAVLVLRDVMELSAEETAAALGITGGNVHVALHRARAALAGYDRTRVRPTPAVQAATRALLERFGMLAASGDVAGLTALLEPGVTAVADGAGRYASSPVPIVGAERVALLYARLAMRPIAGEFALRMANGLPSLWLRYPAPPGKNSPRTVTQVMPGSVGRVARVWAVVVPEKVAVDPKGTEWLPLPAAPRLTS